MKYPRKENYMSRRQLNLARREWRVWNKERIQVKSAELGGQF